MLAADDFCTRVADTVIPFVKVAENQVELTSNLVLQYALLLPLTHATVLIPSSQYVFHVSIERASLACVR